MIKLKADKATVEAFATICQFNYNKIELYESFLAKMFMRNALESLIIKFSRCRKRITKTFTLQFNATEALAFFWSAEYFIEQFPESYEAALVREKFLHPINALT